MRLFKPALLFNGLPDQSKDFARLRMASGLELGIDQGIVNRDFVASPFRREKGDRFDLRLEILKEFVGQAHGSVGIVSDRTVTN